MRAPKPWLVTGVLSLSGLVAALNGTLVIPLIPVLPDELGVSSDDASWLVTATLLVGAVSIPTVSRLADMHGRRRMLLVCLVVMSIGAVLSAIVPDFWIMILGRALAGFGTPLIPIGISVLRDALPANRVGTAVALMSATLGVGASFGLPMAGVLYETAGWKSIFWLTAGVALTLAALVLVVVPRTHDPRGGRFDWPGAILLSGAIAAIMLFISKGGAWGWTSPLSLGLLAGGLVTLVGWGAIELRMRQPLVDLRTSASRPVLFTNIAALLVGFGLLVNLLLAMQQLQAPIETGYGLGMSVLHASALMIPGSLIFAGIAPLNGRLLDRFGGRAVLLVGVGIMAGGYLLRPLLAADAVQIVVSASVVNLGTAFAYAAMPTIIMKSVPVTMTAAANGLNALVRQAGTTSSSAAVAAALATGAIVVGGVGYPEWSSIVLLDVLAAGSCLLAGAFALIVPRRL